MERANFQDRSHHNEYDKGQGIKNNKTCMFDADGWCSCRFSPNFNSQCVGKVVCEEYAYGSFKNEQNDDSLKSAGNYEKRGRKIKSPDGRRQGRPDKKRVLNVRLGSIVVVESVKDKKRIKIGTISSKDNPFYSKNINEIVSLKGIPYKIVKIIAPKKF